MNREKKIEEALEELLKQAERIKAKLSEKGLDEKQRLRWEILLQKCLDNIVKLLVKVPMGSKWDEISGKLPKKQLEKIARKMKKR